MITVIFAAVVTALLAVLAFLIRRVKHEEVVAPVLFPVQPPQPSPEPQNKPVEPVPVPVVPEAPKLSWETQKGAFKLTRIMADELGLTVEQKNVLCASIYQESRFRNHLADGSPVTNANRDKTTGKVWSTDFGIVQTNDYWHIGKGKTFPSVEYVMNNPDKMVRWMAQELKRTGKLQPWASWTSGAYKMWLSPESPMWTLRS